MRKKTVRRILVSLLVVMMLVMIAYRDLLSYALLQGKGQFRILWNTRPVSEVMSDPATSEETLAKLQLVDRVRRFAIDSLGLNDSENYTTFYDQGGKPLLWVVTASDPYALVPYEWRFPIVGKVPYKGYFDLDKTKALGREMKEEGYDVYIREVGGWSTLGWFKDPILSGMLEGSTGDIANLIIHELTHSTVFVRDSVTFNENLASFIGHQGALRFLKSAYGATSEEYQFYKASKSDSYKWSGHFIRGASVLDSLYGTFDGTDTVKMDKLKNQVIRSIIDDLDTIRFERGDQYEGAFQDWTPNNAWFLSFVRYRGENDSLERLLEESYQGDIRQLINKMKNMYPYL